MHILAMSAAVTRAIRQPLAFPVAAIVALTTACGESTAPRVVAAGSFAVTLSGAQAGQYEANGAMPLRAAPRTTATFSAALFGGPTGTGYLVSGFRASSSTRQDVLSLELLGVSQPGTYEADGELVVGIDALTSLPESLYRITDVSVRVTSLTRTRIAGEFSGEAVGGTFPATFPNIPTDTVRFAGGTFDVPIIRR